MAEEKKPATEAHAETKKLDPAAKPLQVDPKTEQAKQPGDDKSHLVEGKRPETEREKKKREKEEEKEKERQEVIKQMADILDEYDGMRSSIPLTNVFWDLQNRLLTLNG